MNKIVFTLIIVLVMLIVACSAPIGSNPLPPILGEATATPATQAAAPTAGPSQTPTLASTATAAPTNTATATATTTNTPTASRKPANSPTLVPTATSTKVLPTATITATALSTITVVATPVSTATQGSWNLQYFADATDQMKGWKFESLVTDWSTAPNADFSKYGFKAADGVEYGMAESAYCQRNQTCDVNVPAMHYRLLTGDYEIPGIDKCPVGTDKTGCGIMLINVGTVTAMYRESSIDYGFTVEGRYWNGDAMPSTVRALLSNTAFNMLNIDGSIFGKVPLPVNPGANCSSAFGCVKVRLTFAIISGNEMLVKGTTLVSR